MQYNVLGLVYGFTYFFLTLIDFYRMYTFTILPSNCNYILPRGGCGR